MEFTSNKGITKLHQNTNVHQPGVACNLNSLFGRFCYFFMFFHAKTITVYWFHPYMKINEKHTSFSYRKNKSKSHILHAFYKKSAFSYKMTKFHIIFVLEKQGSIALHITPVPKTSLHTNPQRRGYPL